MSMLLPIFHFSTITIAIVLPAIGVSLGQALVGLSGIKALNRQPSIRPDITKTLLVGMALTETAAVIGLALAIMLLFGESPYEDSLYVRIAELGIACAIGLPGFIIGLTTARPAIETLQAMSRQPFMARKITNIMLLTQSIGQTGIIFGFIASLFIKSQMAEVSTLNNALRLLSSGVAIGLGAIGPAYGLGHFAQTAIKILGLRPHTYNKILTFTFISEAIIETPLIFALLVSLVLASSPTTSTNYLYGITFLCSGLVIAIGTISPGINSGKVAASACNQISYNPKQYNTISRLSLIGQTLIDTSALYALLIALLLIFFK